MSRELLIVFVKAPRPGEVKTRIAKVVGAQAACDAYMGLVKMLVEKFRALPNVQLRFTPDDAHAEISEWLQPAWKAAPQGNGNLGQRLIRSFHHAFASGAERVLVIGSDSPDIMVQDIQSAWVALEHHDVVLGPAEDGGYWLIGLRSEQASLFEKIPWSSSAVLEQTIARAKTANLSIHLLRELLDIDTADDLRRFQARSAQQ